MGKSVETPWNRGRVSAGDIDGDEDRVDWPGGSGELGDKKVRGVFLKMLSRVRVRVVDNG